ncbi:MAG: glutamate synthase subunit beta [Proteobacteria bacterium]|nr:glutamate synthase subunit beta [Pseudomonadota bacterium]
MGEVKGFMSYERKVPAKEPVFQRVQHYREFTAAIDDADLRKQGARCMDCGVPFCHNGCPLGNVIPEWNHLVSESDYEAALKVLLSTNNFPEFTGRICPAPCETACVLGINEDPVSIEAIEMALADMGFAKGWIKAEAPAIRSGFKVAVVGSGPAGLAAAQQLNRQGHLVTVYERADRPGGLLMYGIPDFKLEKHRILRRVEQLEAEGVKFCCGIEVGVDLSMQKLQSDYDAILLCCGASRKRDVAIPGRELSSIYFAEQFLSQSTRRTFGDPIAQPILATGKDVIVIGGGDTGSDCVGTSHRQGARSVTQFEIMPQAPQLNQFPRAHERPQETPWPQWTHMLRTSSSHEEGGSRHWSLESVEFEADALGQLQALITRELAWYTDSSGQKRYEKVSGSEKRWPCQMVLIAVGFLGADTRGPVEQLNLQMSERGNIQADEYDFSTNIPGVFAAGDVRRGQSLVVWAIAEGRKAAEAIGRYLQN